MSCSLQICIGKIRICCFDQETRWTYSLSELSPKNVVFNDDNVVVVVVVVLFVCLFVLFVFVFFNS